MSQDPEVLQRARMALDGVWKGPNARSEEVARRMVDFAAAEVEKALATASTKDLPLVGSVNATETPKKSPLDGHGGFPGDGATKVKLTGPVAAPGADLETIAIEWTDRAHPRVAALLSAAGVHPSDEAPLYWWRAEHEVSLSQILDASAQTLPDLCAKIREAREAGKELQMPIKSIEAIVKGFLGHGYRAPRR
jgi:hypothetical protein